MYSSAVIVIYTYLHICWYSECQLMLCVYYVPTYAGIVNANSIMLCVYLIEGGVHACIHALYKRSIQYNDIDRH